jgi:Asp-tRNA(Asn)/Glu-tRNA(Gln) amidotransferase A subunit family amidase
MNSEVRPDTMTRAARGFGHRWRVVALSVALACAPAARALDIVDITISDIEAGLAAGSFSVVDLYNAHMARINTYEANYNAFTFFNPTALAEAQALDAEYALTGPRSPLHGVPIVIKEAMDVKGLPSTAGYDRFYSGTGGVDLIPETDAPVVRRLREAGAVIIGKTNIPEFSRSGNNANTSWDGPTYNAYDRTLQPGGSSSGTATAVAGSFAVIGTAEETGGSIQNPAAAQSLASVKTTFGLVPNAGIAPLRGADRDVAGPHARTVHDAAVMLDVMAGYTLEDEKTLASVGNMPVGGYTSLLSDTALEGKRFGLLGTGWRSGITLDPLTQGLYERAIGEMETQGAVFVDDPFAGTNFSALRAAAPNASASNPYYFENWLERMGPSMVANQLAEANGISSIAALGLLGVSPFDPGESFASTPTQFPLEFANPDTPPNIDEVFIHKGQLLSLFNSVLDANDLDGLFFPQAIRPVPDLPEGTSGGTSIGATTVSEINILGVPGVTISGGYYDDGSPFSLIFVGKLWSEAALLSFAYDYEQATMYRVAPDMQPVPVPAALPLLASAIVPLVWRRRRRTVPALACAA